LLADNGLARRRCVGRGREEEYVLLALMISFGVIMPKIVS
jgi:hypothetical protein